MVSIVVLNWNGRKILRKCLTSLITTEYPNFKIILFDNGSTDGSIEAVESEFKSYPKLHVIKSRVNSGITGGYNKASRYAEGKYIMFMNNDIVVTSKDWLRKLVETMESDETIGCAQPQLIFPDGERSTKRQYPFEFAIDAFRSKLIERATENDAQIKEIFHTVGSAMIMRFALFKEIGGFDKDFFVMGEDLDLGYRVRIKGFRNVFVEASKLLHIGSISIKKLGKKSAFHSTKNRLMILTKNYDASNLVFYLPVCIVLTLVSIIFGGNERARLRGFFWFLTNLKHIWMKRMFVQKTIRMVSDSMAVQNNIYTSLFGYGPTVLAAAEG
jgi:GT2 family glycosyltransferase